MISKNNRRAERRHKSIKAEERKRHDRWMPKRPDRRRTLKDRAEARDGEAWA